MRASDIVTQLAIKLPALVNDFTTNAVVTSLTRSGTTVTVTTSAAHNLVVGNAVNITGAKTPITVSSITRVGIVATLVTAADHDITFGPERPFTTVELEGATEAEFNGTFTILSQPNRRTITFQVADAGPTVATGSPLLLNGSSPLQSYDGLQAVTAVPTTTTFEYEVTDSTLFTPASGTIVTKVLPRISAAVSFDRITAAYTKQTVSEAWAFVVLGDGVGHKNRRIDVDSIDNVQRTQDFRQRMSQAIAIFVIIPTSAQIAGREARDRAEELLLPICQSILLTKFDSLLSAGAHNPLQFNEHGFQDYTGAYYVHRYTFEATLQMTTADTIGADEDVAFRDIALTMGLDVGTETFDTDIDLDDVPLP